MSEKRDYWEYRVVRLRDGNMAETELSRHGDNGWELVAVAVQFNIHFCYMKRRHISP